MKFFKINLKNKKQLLTLKNKFDGNLVFGSKKFHKSTYRTGKGPANGKIVEELKKIVSKRNNDERLNKYWEEVKNCPICKSKKRSLFTKRFCLEIKECENCGLGYLSPRVKFKTAVKLYSNEKTNVPIYSSKTNIKMDKIKYKYGLSIINKLGSNQKRCLDLGTGRGIFLEVANNLGWEQCYGFDVNKNWKKKFIEKKGISLINSEWEKINNIYIQNKFDLITMWDAFEHTYDLDYLTKFIKKNLSSNGYFLILVPNFHSLATKTIRSLSPTFAWKHTLYFSKKSLNFWAKKNKMKNIFFETVVSEIDNIKSYFSGKWPYDGYGDPKNIFKNITPEFIHNNHLGSRILAIYKNDN
tara:strand:+ start:1215 stop:2279 length:1065 start_codon:yes stop_codon:yes gene_type:complete